MMGGCLEEELALDLMAGRLSDDVLASVDQHLDGCPLCRELVLALARDSSGAPAPHAPGEQLGRYTLIEQLGRGAFGVVWRAHDQRLDRQVALKLLKGTAHRLPEHLEAEARAMARLAHPHVATVFDVGQLDSAEPFLAMELLEGGTLREWLAGSPGEAEILERLLPVARGLGAAHRAGLVHRDLKPENILFDAEGRAKVTDFGLAAGALPSTDLERVSLAHSMVLPGRLIGTPAYMAPEQLRGEPATEQSDQFALCVVLYEALTGAKPFPAASLEELLARIESPPEPLPRSVSPRVVRALERGLAHAPATRFSSLQALVEALEPRSQRGVTKAWIALAAVAACGLAIWLATKGTAQSQFAPTDPGSGVRAVASEAVEPETARALRHQLEGFEAQTSAWSPARLARAEAFAAGAKREHSDALEARALDLVARGQWELGQLKHAEQTGLQALGAAQRVGDARLEATAWLTLAGVATSAGRLGEAERRCTHVENRLKAVKDASLEASLENTLGVVLTEAGRYAEARRALDRAYAARKQKLGDADPALARVLTNLGNLARAQGDYRLALKEHERAQQIDEARLGKRHPQVARHLHNRARASLLLGQAERAQELYQRALEIERESFGDKHPAVTRTLNSLGLLHASSAKLELAEKYYREAISSSEGFEGLEGALARYNLGLLLLRRHQATAALHELELAAAAVEKILGPGHARTVAIQVATGEALIALQKRESAAFALRRAVKLAEALEVPDPQLVQQAKGLLAQAATAPSKPTKPAPAAAPAVSAAGSYMPGPAFQ